MNLENLDRRQFISLAALTAAIGVVGPGCVEASPAYQETPSEIGNILLVSPESGTQLDLNVFDSIATNSIREDIQTLKANFDTKIANLKITLNTPEGKSSPITNVSIPFTVDVDGKPVISTQKKSDKNMISAFITISGTKDGQPVEGGLLYIPNKNGMWDVFYSDTTELNSIAYGKDSEGNKSPLLIPDSKSKSLLAFQYTDVNKPSPLIAIGVPDEKSHFISWNSAKREMVNGTEFTVQSEIPFLRIKGINKDALNKFNEALQQIPREKGVANLTDIPLHVVFKKYNPDEEKKTVKRYIIDGGDSIGLARTVAESSYKEFPIYLRDEWINKTFSENGQQYPDALSFWMTYAFMQHVGFENSLFGMDYSSTQNNNYFDFFKYLRDGNIFPYGTPIFSATVEK